MTQHLSPNAFPQELLESPSKSVGNKLRLQMSMQINKNGSQNWNPEKKAFDSNYVDLQA